MFPIPSPPTLAIDGRTERFPVRRMYCIGRNYADHAKEMGAVPDKGSPIFFLKPADAIVTGDRVRYPPGTNNLHHEVEMVLALGRSGANVPLAEAPALIAGFAVGLDLTRRDLQTAAKAKGNPWDTGKSFDDCAPIGALTLGLPSPDARLTLSVNDVIRQSESIAAMLWSSAEIIALLSELYTLMPGDLIFTGTPAGVGPLLRGDHVVATLVGAADYRATID